MWGTSAIDQLVCRIIFKGLRYEGIFTPPSEQGSIVYPGNYGVFDWGGIAVDPVRQVLVATPTTWRSSRGCIRATRSKRRAAPARSRACNR
jgi:quinoprotein glucose dehydrogenase